MSYNPRTRRLWDPSPQTEPERFTDAEIRTEIRYLRSLNKRFGEATLRTLAIVRLTTVLAQRQSKPA